MPKYPLEPLSRVRLKKVDDATRTLAGAIATRQDAEATAAHAANAREENAKRAEATRATERDALENGALTAADLARANAWEARATSEQAALARTETKARAKAASARTEETGAQKDVAATKGDASLVDKHRERWREEITKARDAKEEEEIGEAWRPKEPT